MSTCAFSIDQLMELAGLSVSQAGQGTTVHSASHMLLREAYCEASLPGPALGEGTQDSRSVRSREQRYAFMHALSSRH